MKRKKAAADEPQGEVAAWLVTYGDLMSLLLCFFILLASMSSTDAQKLKYVLGSLKGSLGVLEAGTKTAMLKEELIRTFDFVRAVDVTIEKMVKKVRGKKKQVEYVEKMKISTDERGIVFQVENSVLFQPGSDQISPDGYLELDKIIAIVEDLPNQLRVEGHSDSVVGNKSEQNTNWRLSTFRAVSVLKYMIFQGRIDPKRISAMGYGDKKPIAPNDTAENRMANRRVEVILIFKDIADVRGEVEEEDEEEDEEEEEAEEDEEEQDQSADKAGRK